MIRPIGGAAMAIATAGDLAGANRERRGNGYELCEVVGSCLCDP